MIATWQAPLPSGKTTQELLVRFDKGRARRVLILPAWFDEANKMRRFTLELMRALDEADIDSFLPDLPGCNESLAPLQQQTLENWQECAVAIAVQLEATHVLSIRSGALLAPATLPGWLYAPQTGAKALRGMIRARTVASREAGREERSDALIELGRSEGLTLAGWHIGPQMIRDLEAATPVESKSHWTIDQKQLGGPGLWLRAEPDEDRDQSQALAKLVATSRAQGA